MVSSVIWSVCLEALPDVGSPSVSSIRIDAEPSRGYFVSILAPSNNAALISVAENQFL